MAVARHIPLDGSPTEVVTRACGRSVYVLTPATGSIHEIQADRLSFTPEAHRRVAALSMRIAPHESALYVLTREPRALLRVALDSFMRRLARGDVGRALRLRPLAGREDRGHQPRAPSVRLVDLRTRRFALPLGHGDFGAVRFLADSRTMIAANRGERLLSLYDVASATPDRKSAAGRATGQSLFQTRWRAAVHHRRRDGHGRGRVIRITRPRSSETVLAGTCAVGAMAASESFLFIASPQSGDVSILDIDSRKVVGRRFRGQRPGLRRRDAGRSVRAGVEPQIRRRRGSAHRRDSSQPVQVRGAADGDSGRVPPSERGGEAGLDSSRVRYRGDSTGPYLLFGYLRGPFAYPRKQTGRLGRSRRPLAFRSN